MPLFVLIVIVMMNFAANSILNRAGVDVFGMDPVGFAGVRLLAGAVMLGILVRLRDGKRIGPWRIERGNLPAAAMLLVYLVPFSLAYVTLPAGVGALILFGIVQITMFAGSALTGVQPSMRQWGGMAVAMAGLVWLLWPTGGDALAVSGVAFMALAGVGWGLFSMLGRGSKDPLSDMSMSFVLVSPVAVVLIALGAGWTFSGVGVAILCGAVTSGLGYALWYHVLPQIAATTGAVAQLSVPVIALIAGALVLGEAITLEVVLASAVVLGGIALSVIKRG